MTIRSTKPRAKKPHPAEIAAEAAMIEAIRGADHFLASLFKGAGVYEKAEAPTVAGAIKEAIRMEGLARGTQKSMLYAVGKDGRATLLTQALVQRLMTQAFAERGMLPPRTGA